MKNKLDTADTVPLAFEEIADAVMRISDLGSAIMRSNLKQRAILLLIQDITKLPHGDIKKVLDSLPVLRSMYLK